MADLADLLTGARDFGQNVANTMKNAAAKPYGKGASGGLVGQDGKTYTWSPQGVPTEVPGRQVVGAPLKTENLP
jgi:hypothetical protein